MISKVYIWSFLVWILLHCPSQYIFGQERDTQLKSSLTSDEKDGIQYLTFPSLDTRISENLSSENLFTTLSNNGEHFLYIADSQGNPVFYRKMVNAVSNFQAHDIGVLTYYDFTLKGFVVLNSLYQSLDTLFITGPYKTDFHDLVLLENGVRWMMAYDNRIIDMNQVIEGGVEDATVTGLVIQKLDSDDLLLFEWSSWDHFSIVDTYENLIESQVIDYVHGNSINIDTDTSFVLSSRNLSEITRIDARNGDIIWRLGGKSQQFEFINDEGFSGQHSASMLENGNLILYDNEAYNGLGYSRGLEYAVDEENFTATLQKEFLHDSSYYASTTGNIIRLENGHTFIYWGSINEGMYSVISEFDENGTLTFDGKMQDGYKFNYKVYKSSWESPILEVDSDLLYFEQTVVGEADTRNFELYNGGGERISINFVSSKDSLFKLSESLPVQIDPGASHSFEIQFLADKIGDFEDVMNIGYQTDTSIIASQVSLHGNSTVSNDIQSTEIFDYSIYPNPFTENLIIKSNSPMETITIYDLNGKIIFMEDIFANEFQFSDEELNDGVYILSIKNSNQALYRKLIVKM